jgi:hypothetical protein
VEIDRSDRVTDCPSKSVRPSEGREWIGAVPGSAKSSSTQAEGLREKGAARRKAEAERGAEPSLKEGEAAHGRGTYGAHGESMEAEGTVRPSTVSKGFAGIRVCETRETKRADASRGTRGTRGQVQHLYVLGVEEVPWFQVGKDGSTQHRSFVRHILNDRKNMAAREKYRDLIRQQGLQLGLRAAITQGCAATPPLALRQEHTSVCVTCVAATRSPSRDSACARGDFSVRAP